MELKELRVGNYYHWNSQGKDYLYKVEPRDFVRRDYKNFEPVPLTEYWLVKAGAEKYEFDNGNPNQYRIKERLFVIRDNSIYDYGCSVKIDYVHQLQNLYFALTQKELIFKD